jgi:hypothetical protein
MSNAVANFTAKVSSDARRAGGQNSRPSALTPLHTTRPATSAVSFAALRLVAVQFVSGPISVTEPSQAALPDWPAMMTRAQLCGYLGVSWATLKGVLTVAPVDVGANLIRYRRDQVDEWVRSRPPRSQGTSAGNIAVHTEHLDSPTMDVRCSALERARRRADGRK